MQLTALFYWSYLQGYVRFHTAENCASVLKAMSSTNDEVKLEKLTGKLQFHGVSTVSNLVWQRQDKIPPGGGGGQDRGQVISPFFLLMLQNPPKKIATVSFTHNS